MHTFLFKDWTWTAKGVYIDSEDNRIETKGENSFRRDEDKIYNTGYMEIEYENKIRVENAYEVDIFKDEETVSRFFSLNPQLGRLEGEIVIKDKNIHSYYISEDKIYNGFETVEKIDDYKYKATGYFFANGMKISYWELTLEKKVME